MKESNNKTTARTQTKVSAKSTATKITRSNNYPTGRGTAASTASSTRNSRTSGSSRSGSHSNNPSGINQYTKK